VNAYDFGCRVALRKSGARVAVLDVGPNGLHVDLLPIRGDVTRSEDAETEEVAHLIAYLASENLSFSTGACFDLSGGRAVY